MHSHDSCVTTIFLISINFATAHLWLLQWCPAREIENEGKHKNINYVTKKKCIFHSLRRKQPCRLLLSDSWHRLRSLRLPTGGKHPPGARMSFLSSQICPSSSGRCGTSRPFMSKVESAVVWLQATSERKKQSVSPHAPNIIRFLAPILETASRESHRQM